MKINGKEITYLQPFPLFVYKTTADYLNGSIVTNYTTKQLNDDAIEIIKLQLDGHKIEE